MAATVGGGVVEQAEPDQAGAYGAGSAAVVGGYLFCPFTVGQSLGFGGQVLRGLFVSREGVAQTLFFLRSPWSAGHGFVRVCLACRPFPADSRHCEVDGIDCRVQGPDGVRALVGSVGREVVAGIWIHAVGQGLDDFFCAVELHGVIMADAGIECKARVL